MPYKIIIIGTKHNANILIALPFLLYVIEKMMYVCKNNYLIKLSNRTIIPVTNIRN